MLSRYILFSLMSLFILVGCSNQDASETKKINAELLRLQTQMQEMQFKLNDLEQSDQYFQWKDENIVPQFNFGSFTTNAKEYQVINTSSGKFLVALDKISKYVDGYKVDLSIGNVNSGVYDRVKLLAEYSHKKAEVTMAKSLQPGTWNKVSIILSPATAKEISRIRITLQTDSILLRQDYRREE